MAKHGAHLEGGESWTRWGGNRESPGHEGPLLQKPWRLAEAKTRPDGSVGWKSGSGPVHGTADL